ncbi:unnamed protein product, partial [Meganyctiphanes norvegica]
IEMTVISVNFDNPSKIYQPGQTISGYVSVENKNTLSARSITVAAQGYCKVRWTEGSGTDTQTYSNKNKYYKLQSTVWGNGSSSSDLPTGNHTYTFNFVLPHNIPASKEALYGKVVHEIKVNIDIPRRIDKHKEAPYIIKTFLDLNKNPKAKVPIRATKEKHVCCFCCKSGPISAILRIDRTGYIPGDKIIINAECTNMTKRKVTPSAKIVKVTTFSSENFSREKKHHETVSTEIKHPEIKSGDTDFWQAQAITIPDVEPSYLEHCLIIDVHYYLVLELKISKTTKNLVVESEIIIGSHFLEDTDNYSHGTHAKADLGRGQGAMSPISPPRKMKILA